MENNYDEKPNTNTGHERYMPGYVEPETKPGDDADTGSGADGETDSLSGKSIPTDMPQSGMPPHADSGEHDVSGQKWLRMTANLLSMVFSPIVVPTYAYAIMFLTTPLLALSKLYVRSTLLVFAVTAVLPLAVLLFMLRTGKISNLHVHNRRQRTEPYFLAIFCYLAVVVILRHLGEPMSGNLDYRILPSWVPGFFVGAAVAALVDAVVNLRWKISAHATALGGLTAMLILIGLARIATVIILPWISAAILISGAVCSARVFLGRHTLGQVFCGWLVGALVTAASMVFS